MYFVRVVRGQCLWCAGEYWVVGVDTEQYDPANPEKYLKALLRDETNPVAQRAFRSYLGVMPSPPVGFENFSEQVNRYMEKPPFNFPNPLIYIGAYKTVSVGSTGVPCLHICLSVIYLIYLYMYVYRPVSYISICLLPIYICVYPFNIYLLYTHTHTYIYTHIYTYFMYLSYTSIHLFVCPFICSYISIHLCL